MVYLGHKTGLVWCGCDSSPPLPGLSCGVVTIVGAGRGRGLQGWVRTRLPWVTPGSWSHSPKSYHDNRDKVGLASHPRVGAEGRGSLCRQGRMASWRESLVKAPTPCPHEDGQTRVSRKQTQGFYFILGFYFKSPWV